MRRVALALALACDPAPPAAPAAAPPPPAPARVRQLGLTVDLPPGGVIGNATLSAGALVTGGGVGATTLTVASPDWPRTVEEAVADLDGLHPLNVVADPLPDGWIVRFENTGPSGTNYWFHGRREIGGQVYACWTTVTDPAQRDAGAQVCRSLRP